LITVITGTEYDYYIFVTSRLVLLNPCNWDIPDITTPGLLNSYTMYS